MHRTTNAHLGLLLISVLVASASSPALAAPKILNGGACAAEYSGYRYWYDTSGLYNNQGLHTVTCGLPRFNNTNTNGLSSLVLTLNTGNAGANTTVCYAYSISPSGAVLKSVTLAVKVAPNSETTVDFQSKLNVSSSTSSYFVECKTDSNAVLRQVRYNEP